MPDTGDLGSADGPPAAQSGEELPERHYGWWDMFVRPQDDPREADDGGGTGERDVLVRYLRDRRLTLELKCSGLDAAGLAKRSVPPSTMSLLGLLRHVTETEQYWFRVILAEQQVPDLYRTEADRDGAFTGAVADPAVVSRAWDAWRAEVAFAEQLVSSAPDLDIAGHYDHGPEDRGAITLREVMVHMIEEYARHNGHADLLRERVDGRVGQ